MHLLRLPWQPKYHTVILAINNTLNESYNRPPYILAASSENKSKKSMVFILYNRRILAKTSSSNFT